WPVRLSNFRDWASCYTTEGENAKFYLTNIFAAGCENQGCVTEQFDDLERKRPRLHYHVRAIRRLRSSRPFQASKQQYLIRFLSDKCRHIEIVDPFPVVRQRKFLWRTRRVSRRCRQWHLYARRQCG